jgi:GAF domain-containing protein
MDREESIGLAFVDLADTLVDDYDVIDFVQRLTVRCVSLLGVSEAGVVLANPDEGLSVLASSSERMRILELLEVQASDGPCLDCWRTGVAVREDRLETARDRWPNFVPAALEAGFRSVYAVPLRLRSERIGALNLFADQTSGLSSGDERLAQAMADVATIGILHERYLRQHQALAEQLEVALNSRVALEQAKGVVAQQAGTHMDEAFVLLRSYARHHNLRLSAVASDVIAGNLDAAFLRVHGPGSTDSSDAGHARADRRES